MSRSIYSLPNFEGYISTFSIAMDEEEPDELQKD